MSEKRVTTCPKCGTAIPETAETCPSCGWTKTAEAAGQESEKVMEDVEVAEKKKTPDEGKEKGAVQDTETPAAGELPSVFPVSSFLFI